MKNLIASLFLFVSGICCTSTLLAQEFNHPSLFSFEENVAPFKANGASLLSITAEHYKHGTHSVVWKWNKAKAQISIQQPIGYLSQNPDPREAALSTFIFWVYGKKALPSQTMRFEFLKKGKVCSWFDYGMNFAGWRGAWVAFDRDMQGHPEEGMDELRITAPDVSSGEILFDHIILSSFQDIRQHTADFQAPYINPKTNSHWLILNRSWQNRFDLPISNGVSDSELKGLYKVESNLRNFILAKNGVKIDLLRSRFAKYNILQNSDGTVSGKAIFFERFAETYFSMGGRRSTDIYDKTGQALKQANDLLYSLATSYNRTKSNSEKEEIAAMFVTLTRHLTDQGFAAGSALGTIHHLGYSMRNYYPAMFLMKDVLAKAGLDQVVQQSMDWFAGTGEVKLKPTAPGVDIDAFNTALIGRISSILMMKDSPEKVTYLKSFSRWADNGLKVAEGLASAFKSDGTIYHHRNHYPAYAVGGLDGAVAAVTLLANTPFAISQQSHETLKQSLLAFRFYCNLTEWPLSLSGRHPEGDGKLVPSHYSQLAMVGSPDGKAKIDKELASAYLRLTQGKADEYQNRFKSNAISPEISPEGNRTFPYSCLSIHRRGDWMVSIKGFSRYIWDSEIYEKADLYGRYLNFGNMQIMASGNPISNSASGFSQEGWDWNHFWGTTAMVVPIEQLKANVLNVDTCSGVEQMLLSDEAFAGGVSLANQQGVFAMKLHDHDKYNGTLRANKSWFMFDNRIIALGSNIRNASKEYPVETTLFQESVAPKSDSTVVNGKIVSAFPYAQTLQGNSTLCDARGNAYFVKNATVRVARKVQHSLDQETSKPTHGNFALAVISHGTIPVNGSYEYAVLVQPTSTEISAFAKGKSYSVLRCDSVAHIVTDKATQTTGYAFFKSGKSEVKTEIVSVGLPSLLMTRVEGKLLRLSACDPDLRFYEGPADEKFDAKGKRIERSVYSRSWIDNPSKESKLQVEIVGSWRVANENPKVRILRHTGKTTVIEFTCREGKTGEIVLAKK